MNARLKMTASRRRLVSLLISISPALILIGALFLLPLLRLIQLSTTDAYPKPSEVLTFENYAEIFARAFHLTSLVTSLELAVVVTVITAVLGYPLAYYLVRSTSRYKALILLAIISPLLISVVVRSIGWLILLGREGVVNQLLLSLGLVSEPLQLLYNFMTVVVGEVNILMPFMVLSLTTSLSQIPRSLEEGASVMGAGAVQRFLRVTLPLSAPGLISGAMLVFILTMGSYVTPQMLGGGKVNVITTDIYSRMMVDFDWPMGAALSVVTLLLTLSVVVVMSRIQSRLMGGMTR
ncbi:ABC transporter permease [Leifsonia bigeumensis]|uniref:ABC transporter permease n=1 Tax=Leifsonella bigeumensis TaxID=433643 RepID=A0ABP7FHY8_9MICO